jgi:hypothetical protein
MSKYPKGSFITVPNKEKLVGLKPSTQSLYVWLCNHINKDSTCFPSRRLLAKESGLKSVRTVDQHLKILVEVGLITKKAKAKNNLKQSNLYTVVANRKSESGEIVEQKLPIDKQATIEEVEQKLHEGGAKIALGGSANIAHRTQLSSLTQSNEPNPYILSGDDIYEDSSSLEEIENSEDEASSSSQLGKQEVVEDSKPSSVQPSTPEDRKWFKELFCRVMGCVIYPESSEKYNEEADEWGGEGEERWTTSELEVVQNMKVKEFMSRNSHEMAKRKLAWFWHYRNSKQGEWITNPTFTIFLAQEPNFSTGESEMFSAEAMASMNYPEMQGWSMRHVDYCEKDMFKDLRDKVKVEEKSQLKN